MINGEANVNPKIIFYNNNNHYNNNCNNSKNDINKRKQECKYLNERLFKQTQQYNVENCLYKKIIANHGYIPQLNGQNGVYAWIDLPKYTCIGQYTGIEMTHEEFELLYNGTCKEDLHNMYAMETPFEEEDTVMSKLQDEFEREQIESDDSYNPNEEYQRNYNSDSSQNTRKHSKKIFQKIKQNTTDVL